MIEWVNSNKLLTICFAIGFIVSLPFILGGIGIFIVRLISEIVLPIGLVFGILMWFERGNYGK
jgi:hypothetical protein